jgi:hypothetical protein
MGLKYLLLKDEIARLKIEGVRCHVIAVPCHCAYAEMNKGEIFTGIIFGNFLMSSAIGF